MSTKRKPSNQRAKRALAAREPKLVEGVKKCLVLKGPKTSDVVTKCLKDLFMMKKPDGKVFQRRNLTRPFEDAASVEFFSKSNDCSLFLYGSHSKKRPHNLVFGRCFDHQILDMVEVGIEPRSFKPMAAFDSERDAVVRTGSKPMFVFQGDGFETDPDLATLKSVVLDMFRGEELDKVNLAGLSRVVVLTAMPSGLVHFRHYGVSFLKSGTRYPKAKLDPAGPSMDLKIRRVHRAAEELQKQAMRKPKKGDSKKRKNRESGLLGDAMGRVHLEKQDLKELQLRKSKGIKKRKTTPEEEDAKDKHLAAFQAVDE